VLRPAVVRGRALRCAGRAAHRRRAAGAGARRPFAPGVGAGRAALERRPRRPVASPHAAAAGLGTMTLGERSGPLAYAAVFVATVIEGEVVFVAAAVLVHLGRLSAPGVYAAAALGGSLGDQLYFYALRGRLRGWLDRFPTWSRRRDRIIGRVRQHASAMILACRFLPGLRVAIPAACAYAEVGAARFTTLSLLSSLGWAAAV